jgi:hypothetical protein
VLPVIGPPKVGSCSPMRSAHPFHRSISLRRSGRGNSVSDYARLGSHFPGATRYGGSELRHHANLADASSSSSIKVRSDLEAIARDVFQKREEPGRGVGLLQKRSVGGSDLLRF